MRTAEEQTAAMRSTWISVLVNVVLVTAQIVVGVLAKSQALIADGLHSASDVVADIVVLVAARQGNVAADDNHPYGHARFETFAAFVLGLILLITGVGMAVSSGIRLSEGGSVSAVHPIALGVALFTLVAKEGLFRYMRRVGERLQSSMLIANAYHARADAASSLVVAVGIAGNLAGLLSLDAIAAAIVGFMVARSGLQFAWEAFRDLTDHGLSPEETRAIERTILNVEGVRGVHELRTRRMGDWGLVDAHVLVESRLSVSEGHFIAERVRDAVRDRHRVIEAVIHIDPANAHDIAELLSRPTRQALLAALADTLGAPAVPALTARLHYLDTGLEVELDLPPGADAQTLERVQAAADALQARWPDHIRALRLRRLCPDRASCR